MAETKDYWMKDNSIFVCDGWKNMIAPDGSTICTGPVSGANQKPQDNKNPVAKIPTKGKLPPDLEKGIMQQENRGRGRPAKEGEVHRTTKWRREKAEQGVLL